MTSSSSWCQSAGIPPSDSMQKPTSPARAPRQPPSEVLSQSVRPKFPPSERCAVPNVMKNPGILLCLYTKISYKNTLLMSVSNFVIFLFFERLQPYACYIFERQ